MEKFNLSEWLQDKSRKVFTRDGKDVEIIYTNSPVPHHPIVGFIDKSIYTWTIDGKLIYGKEEQDKNDLFFADEKEELTEFEKRIYNLINFSDPDNCPSIEEVKEETEILLDLARKEQGIMKFNIPFYVLRRVFPEDTMWVDGVAEIIGYSPRENIHIVICDGTRTSNDGKYRVQKYRPKDSKYHFEHWNTEEYPYKYLVDEDYAEHLSEEVIDFSKL